MVCTFRRSAAARKVEGGIGHGGVQVRLRGLTDGAKGEGGVVGERENEEDEEGMMWEGEMLESGGGGGRSCDGGDECGGGGVGHGR